MNFKVYTMRRRYLDNILIFLVPISFIVYTSAPLFIICFFIIFGFWYIFVKHPSIPELKSVFLISISVAIYILVSAFYRSVIEQNWENLNSIFPVYLIFTGPLLVGLGLANNPMRAFVYGCRTATVLFATYSLYLIFLDGSSRMGFGTNALIAGYILMLFSCVSRFKPIKNEPDWVGRVYFYVGSIGVLATGSRIIILFYVFILLVDLVFIILNARRNNLKFLMVYFAIMVLCAGIIQTAFGYKLLTILRVEQSFEAITSLNILSDMSIRLRVYMWEFGWIKFLNNPLFGMGAANIHDALGSFIQTTYNIEFAARHLHNLIIHELAAHGLIGAILVLAYHYLIWHRSYGHFLKMGNGFQLNTLFLGIFMYGLTGSHLTDERMILITVITFVFLLKESENKITQVP